MKKGWLLLALLCISVVVLFRPLTLLGCRALLNRAFAGALSYDKMQWEEGAIVVTGLLCQTSDAEVIVDRIELKPAGSWLHLQFAPVITCIHPQITLLHSAGHAPSPMAPFLYRSRFFQPHWAVHNGVVQLPSSRFYFGLEPDDLPNSLGTLLLSYDPDLKRLPMFSADLSVLSEGDLQVDFALRESDLSRLLPLTALIAPHLHRTWERAVGEINLQGALTLDPSCNVRTLHVQGGAKQIALVGPSMEIYCDELEALVSCPEDTTQINAAIRIEGGECNVSSSQLNLEQLSGFLTWEPQEGADLELTGVLAGQTQEMAWNLSGKGGIQEDGTRWSELDLASAAGGGEEAHTHLSLCSHSLSELALRVQMQNVDSHHLEFVRAAAGGPGYCAQGTFAAEWTALLQEGQLRACTLEQLSLQQLHWDFPEKQTSLYLDALQMHAAAKCSASSLSVEVETLLSGEELKGEAHFSRARQSTWQFKEGKLYAPHLTQKSYGAFFPLFLPEMQMIGELEAEAHLTPSHLQVTARGAHVELTHPHATLTLPAFQEKPAQFVCDLASATWSGELPLLDAKLQCARAGLDLVGVGGQLKLEGSGFTNWHLQGQLNNLSFPVNSATHVTHGVCEVALDSHSHQLRIEKGEGTWTLMDGTPLTVQLSQFSTPLSLQKKAEFALKVVGGKKEVACFEGSIAQSPAQSWVITLDEKATHFGGAALKVARCELSAQMHLTSLDMTPTLRCQDLYSQIFFLQNAGFVLPTFSPALLKEWQVVGTLQTHLILEGLRQEFSLQIVSRDLSVKGRKWDSFQLLCHKTVEKWYIDKLEADDLSFKSTLLIDSNGVNFPQFEGNWQGVALKGSGYCREQRFACTLESIKGELKTPPFKGTFAAGAAFAGDFSNPDLPLQIKGEANLFVDVHAPLRLGLNNRKPIRFVYTMADGFVCSGIDAQAKHRQTGAHLAELSAQEMRLLSASDFSLTGLIFSIDKALVTHAVDAHLLPSQLGEVQWKGKLKGTGELHVAQKTPTFRATLDPGSYEYGGFTLPLEQLGIQYEKGIVSLRAKTQMEEKPLWASFQIDISHEPYGMLKLFDHPKVEGLKVLFKTQGGQPLFESVQGSCYGLTCSLAKSTGRKVPQASVLTGEIRVDGHLVRALLPKDARAGLSHLKFGQGYQWQGDLVLFQDIKKGGLLQGTLSGKEFELLGYRFHTMQASLDANLNRITLSNLKIEDPAGTILAKKIELNKADGWDLSIPHLLVRQLCPSLMRKIDAEPSPVKPFLIRNLTLTDLCARLGDKTTLEASGELTFVNQFKKEASIFDAPLELIKKMGLDPSLLTPVQGELQLELRGDKFYLLSLDNAFSEGDHSEFYLAAGGDLSYIDLDGKVHIDLKVRQDVVLKLIEPFTLTIRGTLDKPRYGLHY